MIVEKLLHQLCRTLLYELGLAEDDSRNST